MHEYLNTTETPNSDVSQVTERPGMTHQRYDSGSHEQDDSDAFQEELHELQSTNTSKPLGDKKPTLPPLQEELLWHSLFRLRNRTMRPFDCVGCRKTHTNSLPLVWLLHGCRHFVHAACLHELRDADCLLDEDGCYRCAHLKLRLKDYSREELDVRQNRLLEATKSDTC